MEQEDGMLEKEIEQRLVEAAKRVGGLALKFVSPGYDGMPDRILLLPGGRISFVEVKAPGMKPRPLQQRRHELLVGFGFKVYVVDDGEQIEQILKETGGGA
jgi:hypothetical protein